MRTAFLVILCGLISTRFLAQAPKPENAGRVRLETYLDGLADAELKVRSEAIAKVTTRAAAEARQAAVHSKLLKLIGGLPERTPLAAKSMGVTEADGYRIERVLFESLPATQPPAR